MRFRKGDAIHRKGTKSWFLNPPAWVDRVIEGGYRISYPCADFNRNLSHSEARQWEVVIKAGTI